MSATFPGVSEKRNSRPWLSVMAWILVVRPPRERPMACSAGPQASPHFLYDIKESSGRMAIAEGIVGPA
jgi:hypothetical protein